MSVILDIVIWLLFVTIGVIIGLAIEQFRRGGSEDLRDQNKLLRRALVDAFNSAASGIPVDPAGTARTYFDSVRAITSDPVMLQAIDEVEAEHLAERLADASDDTDLTPNDLAALSDAGTATDVTGPPPRTLVGTITVYHPGGRTDLEKVPFTLTDAKTLNFIRTLGVPDQSKDSD